MTSAMYYQLQTSSLTIISTCDRIVLVAHRARRSRVHYTSGECVCWDGESATSLRIIVRVCCVIVVVVVVYVSARCQQCQRTCNSLLLAAVYLFCPECCGHNWAWLHPTTRPGAIVNIILPRSVPQAGSRGGCKKGALDPDPPLSSQLSSSSAPCTRAGVSADVTRRTHEGAGRTRERGPKK